MTICGLFCNDVIISSSLEEHINLQFQDQLSFVITGTTCAVCHICFVLAFSVMLFLAEILPVPEDCYDNRVSPD